MIKVLIKREGNKFVSLEVKGHANSAPHGEDLICAAVSAVVTGGFNSLENIKDFEAKLDEGYAYLKANKTVSSHDEIVIETIINSLKTIAEDNGEFIQIKNL